MAEQKTILWIIGIIVLLVLFSEKVDLGSFTVFPEKIQADIWNLQVTDQNGINVYNEGDSLNVGALLSSARLKEIAILGATPDRLISGSGNCFYNTGYGSDVFRPRCPTPPVVYNNPNYQPVGEPIWKKRPGVDPSCTTPPPTNCETYDWITRTYTCSGQFYDLNYKSGYVDLPNAPCVPRGNDCGPFVWVDDKLCGYNIGACESLTPGFHEVEYLGWYEPMAGSGAKYYCPSKEMYLSTEIYVIPDPCELTVDQALVLEGPFTEPFSSADLSHSVDKYCSRFAPLVFNSQLGFAYDDIALERYYKLTSGETIIPNGYEEIFVFYVTSDFGLLCTGEDEVYSIEEEQCVKPSQLLNVIRCEEGTLETQDDGSVICVKQGQTYIQCEAGATFDQELQRCTMVGETIIVCPTGSTLDSSLGLCIVEGETESTCTNGVWDSSLGLCIVEGETEFGCTLGIWDEEEQKCIVEGEIDYFCSEGYYDVTLDKCILGEPDEPSPTLKQEYIPKVPYTSTVTDDIIDDEPEEEPKSYAGIIIVLVIIGLILYKKYGN